MKENAGVLVYNDQTLTYPTLQGNYLWFYDELSDAIVNDKTVPATAKQGFQTMRIIETAKESSDKQMIIKL